MEDDAMISERDDAYLVEATLGGTEEAFTELARRYRKAAFGIAFSRLGNYEAALDVAQEALVTAYLQLPVLRDHSRFAAWLYRITSNVALMQLRGRHESVSLDSPFLVEIAAPGPDPLVTLQQSDEALAVREALTRLSETDRLAVVLHYVGGYSHEEIADMLDVSVSAVKSRGSRARRQLREEMLNTMEAMGNTLPDVEVTEDLLSRALVKLDGGEHGTIAALGGGPDVLLGIMPGFTERTADAICRIAERAREEGCRWLVAPWHLPDGSPALDMLKNLGFETMPEMRQYERDLTDGVPAIPALDPGFEVRKLTDADPKAVLALLRATVQKHAPEAIDEQHVQRCLGGSHTVKAASLAAYRGDRLAAFVLASGIVSWEFWTCEPGTGLFGWTTRDPGIAPESLLAHLIAVSLRSLKKAGLKRAVLQPQDELIPILQGLGFVHVRSLWNLKLRLRPDE
jgi:RNA polymerase sigma-70 factor (ECF subfamily)